MRGDRPEDYTTPGVPAARSLGTQSVVQTIRIVNIQADPRCRARLERAVDELRKDQAKSTPLPALLAIRSLHFLSMMVFTDDHYDPTLVIEANFDGPAGPFWAELDAAIGPQLREMLRCCRPYDPDAAIFKRVTEPGSQMPLAPLLEAIATSPAAWHLGHRGFSRARIEAEAQVFLDAQAVLVSPNRTRGKSASQLHQLLREELLEKHPCLQAKPPWLVSLLDDIGDWFQAWLFGTFVLLALELPGALLIRIIPFVFAIILWPAAYLAQMVHRVMPWIRDLPVPPPFVLPLAIIIPTFGVGAWFLLGQWRQIELATQEQGTRIERPSGNGPINWQTATLMVVELVSSIFILGFLGWTFEGVKQPPDWVTLGWMVGLGLAGAIALVLMLLARLRYYEERDAWQDLPLDPKDAREIAKFEDRPPGRNHMASLVHTKSGWLRSFLMGVGLTLLGFVMRTDKRSRNGYLINVRTIHFAHLTLLNNSCRLMFLSNFDGSWENYLTDFIEKVRMPLNLTWTPGVGFPPTLFYVLEGVMRGRLFRAWKRSSMTPTLFWFDAYPKLSVEQIWRQAEIAKGLRRTRLNDEDAKLWAAKL